MGFQGGEREESGGDSEVPGTGVGAVLPWTETSEKDGEDVS